MGNANQPTASRSQCALVVATALVLFAAGPASATRLLLAMEPAEGAAPFATQQDFWPIDIVIAPADVSAALFACESDACVRKVAKATSADAALVVRHQWVHQPYFRFLDGQLVTRTRAIPYRRVFYSEEGDIEGVLPDEWARLIKEGGTPRNESWLSEQVQIATHEVRRRCDDGSAADGTPRPAAKAATAPPGPLGPQLSLRFVPGVGPPSIERGGNTDAPASSMTACWMRQLGDRRFVNLSAREMSREVTVEAEPRRHRWSPNDAASNALPDTPPHEDQPAEIPLPARSSTPTLPLTTILVVVGALALVVALARRRRRGQT